MRVDRRAPGGEGPTGSLASPAEARPLHLAGREGHKLSATASRDGHRGCQGSPVPPDGEDDPKNVSFWAIGRDRGGMEMEEEEDNHREHSRKKNMPRCPGHVSGTEDEDQDLAARRTVRP